MLKQKLICCVLAASLVAGCAVPALGDTQADIATAAKQAWCTRASLWLTTRPSGTPP